MSTNKDSRNKDSLTPNTIFRSVLTLLLLVLVSACVDTEKAEEEEEDIVKMTMVLSIDLEALLKNKVVLKASMKNNSEQKVVFLPWNTPFDRDITGSFLSVRLIEGQSEQEVAYRGRMVKRLPPRQSDYVQLEAGSTIENALELTKAYLFCANRQYVIEFDGFLFDDKDNVVDSTSNVAGFTTGDHFPKCR